MGNSKHTTKLEIKDNDKMSEARRLNLMSLEGEIVGTDGNARCFLEVEYLPNGDAYVNMTGQNKGGTFHYISAQIANPVRGGGGDIDDYKILRKIYDVLKKTSE